VRDDEPMRPRASVAIGAGVARGLGIAYVAAVLLSTALAGCSSDDDSGRADDEGPTTTAVAAAPGATSDGIDPSGPSAPPGSGSVAVTAESLPEVPETGIPGLDSDDVVCRAWSRFGGSFQVLAVAAAFGAGDPVAVAALEVAASPTVTAAYGDLVANWPDELADEAELVADEYLGAFARRADRALAALEGAGADAPATETIVAAWETALAGRDPAQPEIVITLPADVQAIVDAAAAEFAAQVVPIPSDPSLVTDVEVPLTERYFVDHCPDRGTLGGVDG
jgi:hypothetical protein